MRKRLFLLLVLTLLAAMLIPTGAMAKSYSISRVLIEGTLRQDGSLEVIELRTFRFEGGLRQVHQRIRLQGRNSLGMIGLTDEERGLYREADDQAPGTFRLTRETTGVRLDWYFQPTAIERTYTLTYRIADAIRMRPDGVELDWRLIGSDWEAGTELAEVIIRLPGEPIDAWVEGAVRWEHRGGQQIEFTARNLAPREGLTLRAFLPRSAVQASAMPPEGEPIQDILIREGRRSDPVSIFFHGAWLLAAFAAGARFYRRHVRPPVLDWETAVPLRPLPPVMIACFMGRPVRDGIRATLIDLARRGAVRVEQEGESDWRFTRVYRSGLQPAEVEALDMFLSPGKESVTLSEWRSKETHHSRNIQRQRWWRRLRIDGSGRKRSSAIRETGTYFLVHVGYGGFGCQNSV